MESFSSDSVITGSVIFLTITALPESEAQTSLALKPLFSKRRLIEFATALASIMAPSTIASAGTGSMPKAATRKSLAVGLSSTAFTALDPMSSPTTLFCFRNTITSVPQDGDLASCLCGTQAQPDPGSQLRPSPLSAVPMRHITDELCKPGRRQFGGQHCADNP